MINRLLGALIKPLVKLIPWVGKLVVLIDTLESLFHAVVAAYKKVKQWLLDRWAKKTKAKIKESVALSKKKDKPSRLEGNKKSEEVWKDFT